MKTDSPSFLFLRLNLCRGVGIDPVDDTFDPSPQGQICENLHDTSTICEGRFLKHRQVKDMILKEAIEDRRAEDARATRAFGSSGEAPQEV